MKQRYSFRTEFVEDSPRALQLIEALGLKPTSAWTEADGSWRLGFFTVESEESLETLRKRMEETAIGDPARFADLHRCYQTLAEGDEPNELWYRRSVPDTPPSDLFDDSIESDELP